MPLYQHIEELKRAEQLMSADKISCCITCRHWEVEKRRTESMAHFLALCLQPENEAAQLVVSGASGCNRWERHLDVSDDAEAYSHKGERIAYR